MSKPKCEHPDVTAPSDDSDMWKCRLCGRMVDVADDMCYGVHDEACGGDFFEFW